MNPYIILAALLAVIGAAISGYWKGSHDTNTEWVAKTEKARADAEAQARKTEKERQEATNAIVRKLTTDLETNRGRLNTALDSLRNRPDTRLPVDSRPACAGATGAELSRPDAVFLTREAARGDDLRASLAACYSFIDKLREKK